MGKCPRKQKLDKSPYCNSLGISTQVTDPYLVPGPVLKVWVGAELLSSFLPLGPCRR